MFEGLKRFIELRDSEYHGFNFCCGVAAEGLEDPARELRPIVRYVGDRKKIFNGHFRNIKGTVPKFRECFIDEGSVDPFDVIATLRDADFTEFLITDHVPHIVDDTSWGHRGRAYAIGYMKALIDGAYR